MIYDAVVSARERTVRLVCPPFLNLAPFWRDAQIRQGGKRLDFEILSRNHLAEVVVSGVDPRSGGVALTFASRSYEIPFRIAPDQRLLAGRRVLYTQSKDNRLEWILDWIRYYRDIHAIDAVLIFDNGSTAYTADQLDSAMRSVAGIRESIVVRWPIKRGPGKGPQRRWDSNFGQTGAFAVARWRFLQSADLVINSDVDELLLPSPRRTLLQAARRSRYGMVSFEGRWTVGIQNGATPGDQQDLRHRDFIHSVQPGGPSDERVGTTKWAICPRRNRHVAQWRTHAIAGVPRRKTLAEDFSYRHFQEINTGWKRDRTARHHLSDPLIYRDDALISAYDRVRWSDQPADSWSRSAARAFRQRLETIAETARELASAIQHVRRGKLFQSGASTPEH